MQPLLWCVLLVVGAPPRQLGLDSFSLDVANDGVFEPVMADTGNYSGQLWAITPIRAGEYRLVPLFQPGRSLTADGSRLSLAPTIASATQSWTIRRVQ